jgi:hypothetical protein
MNDTHPKISEKFEEMLVAKTTQERLVMGCSMFEMSKRLVVSSILQQNPHSSPSFLRREVFLRIYGHEFDSKTVGKIVQHLMNL